MTYPVCIPLFTGFMIGCIIVFYGYELFILFLGAPLVGRVLCTVFSSMVA